MKCPRCQTDNPSDSKYCKECATPLPVSGEVSVTKTLEAAVEGLKKGMMFAERYEIIEGLGTGGMGKVYRVKDKKLDEEMALKVLRPEIAADRSMIERFKNELKLARKIAHRSVCRMYDLNEEEGTHFITMEYVPGEDLKSYIRKKGKISEGDAISIAKQVCEGLAEAHELGVVHRDLKPQNIMIGERGRSKIMDFGIARSVEAPGVTQTGVMIGTPDYISPEQAEGEEADQRSDIYSLGVILYEMVTGSVPFKGDTALSVALKHKAQLPQDPRKLNPEVSEDLARLILVCMEKDRRRRYQTAGELLSELNKIEKGIPIAERMPLKRKLEIKWKNILLYGGVPLLLILLIAGTIFLFTGHAEAIDSIAVLPVQNLSGDPNQEYLSDGITDALIYELSKISALRVISRTSVMFYKKEPKPLPEVARELNVGAVVEASVLTDGSTVQIKAKLIRVPSEENLWVQSFDRQMSDILALQGEMAQTIAQKIKIKLTTEEKSLLTSARSVNPEAHKAFLRGRYIYETESTLEGMKKAIEYFQNALAIDPNYALAYVGLSEAWFDLAFNFLPPGQEEERKVAKRRARETAQRALEIDDTLSEAQSMMAYFYLYYDWNWQKAESAFKRALEINPNDSMSRVKYVEFLCAMGRLDEAIKQAKRAEELDPLSTWMGTYVGMTLRWARQTDEAIQKLKEVLEREPNSTYARVTLGHCYWYKGLYKEAMTTWAKMHDLTGNKELAKAFVELSVEEAVHKWLEQAKGQVSSPVFNNRTSIAAVHAMLGEKEQALEWLEKAYLAREPDVVFLKINDNWDSLRDDPRFQDLVRRINFPEDK